MPQDFVEPTTTQRIALRCALRVARIRYFVFGRTTVIGPPIQPCGNLVLFTNHRSISDSFFIGAALFWETRLSAMRLLPWNVPKKKWYTRMWPIAQFLSLVRCIPIRIDEKNRAHDMRAFHRIVSVLRQGGVVHLFPEGTRGRSDAILPIMPSACSIALLAKSSILIAYHRRSGRHHVIVTQRLLTPDDVENIAKGATLKERSQSFATYVQWTLESLQRLSFTRC